MLPMTKQPNLPRGLLPQAWARGKHAVADHPHALDQNECPLLGISDSPRIDRLRGGFGPATLRANGVATGLGFRLVGLVLRHSDAIFLRPATFGYAPVRFRGQ